MFRHSYNNEFWNATQIRRLSAELDVAQRIVVRHMKAIGKVSKRCREVPYYITENKANKCIEIYRNTLKIRVISVFFSKLLLQMKTDLLQSWQKVQWLDIGQVSQPVSKKVLKKGIIVRLVEFWKRDTLWINFTFLLQWQNVINKRQKWWVFFMH